jgi:hypothetical protein
MSTDLDILKDHFAGPEAPSGDLATAFQALERAIEQEEETESGKELSPRRGRRSTRWTLGGLAAVAVAIALTLLLLPASNTGTPEAAAAEINRMAAASPQTPELQAGQWSHYEVKGSLSIFVDLEGNNSKTISSSKMDVPIDLHAWSNGGSALCTSEDLGTATFATQTAATTWHAMGLLDTPTNQPATSCSAGVGTAVGGGALFQTIDVTHLTHNPSTLAKQLENGTTGLGLVDNSAQGDASEVPGFIRLTQLLVGPTSGGWPGLNAELLRTMALLPGVIDLGDMQTHSGQTGLAFSVKRTVPSTTGGAPVVATYEAPTVILDPTSGILLEARNYTIPLLTSVAQDFVSGPNAAVYTHGVSYGANTDWMDPVAPASVVDQTSLPSWTQTIHIIQAVPKATTTPAEAGNLINPYLGNGTFDEGVEDSTSHVNIHNITLAGSEAQAQSLVSVLVASGLFTSVTLEL